MIDEKHRHEIAEAMRRCDPKAFGWPIGLASAIAQASDGGQDPLHELADLIDRPTCHVVKHETYYGSFGCEEAGELWTLSCGDECINDSDFPPDYCPVCGAEVVSADDERREVVARLREWLAIPWYKRPLSRDAMQSIGEMVGAVPGENIVERIADLIDHQTCRNVSGCQDVFECSECRCRAELVTEVCNEHGDPFHVPLMPSFCPNCGAVVVEKEEDDD